MCLQRSADRAGFAQAERVFVLRFTGASTGAFLARLLARLLALYR